MTKEDSALLWAWILAWVWAKLALRFSNSLADAALTANLVYYYIRMMILNDEEQVRTMNNFLYLEFAPRRLNIFVGANSQNGNGNNSNQQVQLHSTRIDWTFRILQQMCRIQ